MLLNEFLKEHTAKSNSSAKISRRLSHDSKSKALTSGLQKVTAQLELSKSATQTALNNQ